MPAIETDGLTKTYGASRGIEDVTFAVEPGEVFGFLGPNGAGKTTTIRTLLDLLHPTAESGRLDVLLSAPVSRRRLVAASFLATAVELAAVLVLTGLLTGLGTGAVAGVLVAMYVVDLVGRLDSGLDWVRYASVFRYYGNAIEDGIEPLAFAGVSLAAVLLAALGAWLFDRRDLSG